MKPQTEEQWLMVLAVIERMYAEVRAGNWDGLRQMLHGYTTSPPEPSAEPEWLTHLRTEFAEGRAGAIGKMVLTDRARRLIELVDSMRRAPEPGDKARLMEYAVAAGDAIVAGVPQWRDGWAIVSRIQTDPPNERWMLHDADEREKESRAEAEQLALVNAGMDFAVVPIKWRTPTKDDKHG